LLLPLFGGLKLEVLSALPRVNIADTFCLFEKGLMFFKKG
jgi:hypothetical protein